MHFLLAMPMATTIYSWLNLNNPVFYVTYCICRQKSLIYHCIYFSNQTCGGIYSSATPCQKKIRHVEVTEAWLCLLMFIAG